MFCGISNTTKRYISDIERIDISQCIQGLRTNWSKVNLQPGIKIAERQGLGAAQLDNEGIMIVGGFGGKFLNESLYLHVGQNKIYKTKDQPTENMFPFAVPTVSKPEEATLYTVDWTAYKLFRFKNQKWQTLVSLKP